MYALPSLPQLCSLAVFESIHYKNTDSTQLKKLLKENGIHLSASSFSRCRNGESFFPEEAFPVLFKETFCQNALETDPSLERTANALFEAIDEELLHGQNFLCMKNWKEMIADNEEEWKNSSFRYSYLIAQAYSYSRQMNKKKLNEALDYLEPIIEQDSRMKKPVLHPDERALFHYVKGLYQLNFVKDTKKAFNAFVNASTLSSGYLLKNLHDMTEYSKLRVFGAWNNMNQAIISADLLTQTFYLKRCYYRAWDVQFLRIVYLTRLFRFEEAKKVLEQLYIQACLSNQPAQIQGALVNSIWVDMCMSEFELALDELDHLPAKEKKLIKNSIWYPLAVYWTQSEKECRRELAKTDKKLLDPEDRKFFNILYWISQPKNQKSTDFPFEKEEIWFKENSITEMLLWMYDLEIDHCRKIGCAELAQKIFEKKNELMIHGIS